MPKDSAVHPASRPVLSEDALPDHLLLDAGGTSFLLDIRGADQPVPTYWGPRLPWETPQTLEAALTANRAQRVSGGTDAPAPLTLLPQQSSGWLDALGLSGHRQGVGFASKLKTMAVETDGENATIWLQDPETALTLKVELTIEPSGLLRQRLTLTNEGESDYTLDNLSMVFPLPPSATEVLDTTGHHLRERSPQRHDITTGTYMRESFRGRPGADSTLFMAAGPKGFGFEHGLTHAVHLAWSGNSRVGVTRTTSAETFFTVGELLMPGEIILAPGQSYETPWAFAAWGEGLNAVSKQFHDYVRTRESHPQRPRPVTLNTWEAVYFDHNLEKLSELADVASEVGTERFVLDDGWFLGRRDDTRGLGDWYVDEAVWPDGLQPLITKVEDSGMEFGLWVEPEMVSPDSDLARNHPDWILKGRQDLPVSARQQQVLDLTNPEAYDYIRERLLALLDEYNIAYLKWDHNRDLLEAGSGGAPRFHEQTKALYRLLSDLKETHPELEIESCASGGARVDLGIADYTDRFHTSDSLDPTERLVNQRYTGVVIPPELLSAHLTTPTVHSSKRQVSVDYSAAVALLGHFGIEWDLTTADEPTLARVREAVTLWKENRDLISTGTVIHADLADPSLDVRGVVSEDQAEGLFTITQVTSSPFHPVGNVHFPGLREDAQYALSVLADGSEAGPGQSPLPWTQETLVLTGQALSDIGVRAPAQFPQTSTIVKLEQVPYHSEDPGLAKAETQAKAEELHLSKGKPEDPKAGSKEPNPNNAETRP